MNTFLFKHNSQIKQRGSVLVVSLMILVVLTLLGISSMSGSIVEEKMASNSRDYNLAFQAAETAMRNAENFVDSIASMSAFGTTTGLYATEANPDVHDATIWTNANSIQLAADTIEGVYTQPRYIVELLSSEGQPDINISNYGESSGIGAVNTFRITVRATGGSDDTVVMLQTHYR